MQTSHKLSTLWGKPIACEVKRLVINVKTMDVPIARLKEDFKTEFARFYQEYQLENERNGRVVADQVKSEETLDLNYAMRVMGEICRRYQTRFDDN